MANWILLLLLILATGCGDKPLESKSTVDPLFAAQKLSERYGNGKSNILKIKIPITQDTLGHYNYSEVAEDQLANKLDRSIFQSLIVSLKYTLFNWGVGMGISNRVRYTTDFKVPEISPEYFSVIKSIKINKIFFSLMPCDYKEPNCYTREEDAYPASFAFLDKFFVNISMVGSRDDLEFVREPLKYLTSREFDDISKKSFRQIPIEFQDLAIQDGEILEDFFKDVNLTKFHNEKSTRDYKQNIRDEGQIFLFHMKSNPVDFRKELEAQEYASLVKDTTIIGKTVYVELYDKSLRTAFFRKLNEKNKTFAQRGIESTTGCSYVNCLTPKVNPINFVPLFKKSSHIKLDTYLSIRLLDYNDFKYKGFVEFEIVLDLPI